MCNRTQFIKGIYGYVSGTVSTLPISPQPTAERTASADSPYITTASSFKSPHLSVWELSPAVCFEGMPHRSNLQPWGAGAVDKVPHFLAPWTILWCAALSLKGHTFSAFPLFLSHLLAPSPCFFGSCPSKLLASSSPTRAALRGTHSVTRCNT